VFAVLAIPRFVLAKGGFSMFESNSDQPITITAQPTAHPAIRKLARACIALARQHQLETPSNLPAQEEKIDVTAEDSAHD
jgi:hypothetical protein